MDKWKGRESEANGRVVEVEKIGETIGGDECEETHGRSPKRDDGARVGLR
jgi:hypothetical protein